MAHASANPSKVAGSRPTSSRTSSDARSPGGDRAHSAISTMNELWPQAPEPVESAAATRVKRRSTKPMRRAPRARTSRSAPHCDQRHLAHRVLLPGHVGPGEDDQTALESSWRSLGTNGPSPACASARSTHRMAAAGDLDTVAVVDHGRPSRRRRPTLASESSASPARLPRRTTKSGLRSKTDCLQLLEDLCSSAARPLSAESNAGFLSLKGGVTIAPHPVLRLRW